MPQRFFVSVLAIVATSLAVGACSSAPANALSGSSDLTKGDDDDDDDSSSKPSTAPTARPSSSATAATAPFSGDDDDDSSAPASSAAVSNPVVGAPPPAAPVPPVTPAKVDTGSCEQTCINQHPQGAGVESVERPAFVSCVCAAAACANVCSLSSLCLGSATPLVQDAACTECIETTDSPDLDACFETDAEVCPDGSDCAALRDCLNTCEAGG